ncbi:MAG: hypothetical protein OXI53_06515 [Nitrospira sp.]|nr:hypothetical protein [Nitrospira sp.]
MNSIWNRRRCALTALRAFHTALSDITKPNTVRKKADTSLSVAPISNRKSMIPSATGPNDVPSMNGVSASNMRLHPGHAARAAGAITHCMRYDPSRSPTSLGLDLSPTSGRPQHGDARNSSP